MEMAKLGWATGIENPEDEIGPVFQKINLLAWIGWGAALLVSFSLAVIAATLMAVMPEIVAQTGRMLPYVCSVPVMLAYSDNTYTALLFGVGSALFAAMISWSARYHLAGLIIGTTCYVLTGFDGSGAPGIGLSAAGLLVAAELFRQRFPALSARIAMVCTVFGFPLVTTFLAFTLPVWYAPGLTIVIAMGFLMILGFIAIGEGLAEDLRWTAVVAGVMYTVAVIGASQTESNIMRERKPDLALAKLGEDLRHQGVWPDPAKVK